MWRHELSTCTLIGGSGVQLQRMKHRMSISLKRFYSSFGADGLRSQVSLVATDYTKCFSRDIALIERSLYSVQSLLRSVYTSMAIIYGKVMGIYGKWDYRWRKWKRSIVKSIALEAPLCQPHLAYSIMLCQYHNFLEYFPRVLLMSVNLRVETSIGGFN